MKKGPAIEALYTPSQRAELFEKALARGDLAYLDLLMASCPAKDSAAFAARVFGNKAIDKIAKTLAAVTEMTGTVTGGRRLGNLRELSDDELQQRIDELQQRIDAITERAEQGTEPGYVDKQIKRVITILKTIDGLPGAAAKIQTLASTASQPLTTASSAIEQDHVSNDNDSNDSNDPS